MIPSVLASSLRDVVMDYLRASFDLADREREAALFDVLSGSKKGLFKDAWIDLRLPFRSEKPDRPPLDFMPPFAPYAHQLRAFERLSSRGRAPQNTLVTTGTGSGKTESFLYPLLDHCRRQDGPGIKAIILYPMNALATDQARRLAQLLHSRKELAEVSAGLYVGGQGRHGVGGPEHLVDKREILRNDPPDLLLTNYRMLDFLLLRPDDRDLWRHNKPGVLKYLVLDELHTYDGAQGSDVACLIRRLRARLCGSEPLCCVGTSATIGESGEEGKAALRGFASRAFGEAFEAGSIITESRMSLSEALGDVIEAAGVPAFEEGDLDPQRFPDREAWLDRQKQLWLGVPGAKSGVLAERLARHGFLRSLLQALEGRPRSYPVIDRRLSRLDAGWSELPPERRPAALDAFLALVSLARDPEDPKGQRPFLQCRVQLWFRELRRLLARVGAGHDFAWQEELPDDAGRWLPLAHCRDCGGSGFAAAEPIDSGRLVDDPSVIGGVWLNSHRNARYVQIIPEEDGPGQLLFAGEEKDRLCPLCLRVSNEAHCGCQNVATLRVRVDRTMSGGPRPRFKRQCPDCGGEGALSILGSRAASLLSVAITQLFLSPWNDDRKLIAFTDSVQESSHKAGYFSARAYRFNLRAAIQSLIQSRGPAPLKLHELGASLLDHWREQLDDRALVAALLPPDLGELEDVRRFRRQQGRGQYKRLLDDLARRLSWEVQAELGLKTRRGRSLENCRCATLIPEPALLEKASAALFEDLEEKALFPADRLSLDAVKVFLRGLCDRLRRQGGIDHPLLQRYIESEGKWFQLTKGQNPLMAPFGSRSVLPRFFHSHRRPLVFESWDPPAGTDSWMRLWTARAFRTVRKDGAIKEALALAITRLAEAGLLRLRGTGKKDQAAGLRPEALRVVAAPKVLRCAAATCHEAVTILEQEAAFLDGSPCPRFRCPGRLERRDEAPDVYYSRIYGSGKLHRVFAHEHTGLLSRNERERVEEDFKSGRNPEGPNVLVCTPTLELGVDVGDLSAVLLCSVPPATPNYLQRIGRAGRSTGNALCLTLAESRPHDLYFFDQPKEMIAGAVLPPGCYLDAPRMLERQLAAFAIDRWAASPSGPLSIPRRSQDCYGAKGQKGFPGRFLKWYPKQAAAITADFLSIFEGELSVTNAGQLKDFGESSQIPDLIDEAFKAVKAEIEELRRYGERLKRRLEELVKEPEKFEGEDERKQLKEEYEDARAVLGRLMKELAEKYPLNVLTDAGILPNYAFPEPGVTLRSVVRRDQRKDEAKAKTSSRRRRYDTFEYLRPASSAIRELAPFNIFYAEGRRVRINEIDVGRGEGGRLEPWRLCAECHYMEREGDSPATQCPRCQDPNWVDAGQLRSLVHFRRSRSLSDALSSLTVDDRDDRDAFQYETLDLIDIGPEQARGARVVESLPFGFELLQRVTLRELNFGPAFGRHHDLKVAGKRVAEEGFDVCADCGRVREPEGAGDRPELYHAAHCNQRKRGKKSGARIEKIFLYREVESEALRILLPVSTVEVEESLASFKAAIQLGFRKHFKGNPGHLLIQTVSEPVPGSKTQRRTLVIYDGVPGGTGVLVELWNDDGAALRAVFVKARDALQSCPCANVDGRDGCYRCLFAYQARFDLPSISRKRALELLGEILERWDQLADASSLSELRLEDRLESELEKRFVARLAGFAARDPGASWSEVPHKGKRCYKISFGERVWRLEPQVDMDEAFGVAVKTRADFVLTCLSGSANAPKIAVYCDGFEYHGCPKEARGRISDDIRKRRAILDVEGLQVWSLSWQDIEEYEPGTPDVPTPGWLPRLDRAKLDQVLKRTRVNAPLGLAGTNSLAQLIAFLRAPSPAEWRGYAEALLGVAASALGPGGDRLAEIEQGMRAEAERFSIGAVANSKTPPETLGFVDERPWLLSLVSLPKASLLKNRLGDARVLMRIFDEYSGRSAPDFLASWRTMLASWNLLQFHPGCELLGSEMKPEDRVGSAAAGSMGFLIEGVAAEEAAVAVDEDRLAQALAESDEDGHELLRAAFAAGAEPSDWSYPELSDDKGMIVAEGLLMWESRQLIVMRGDEPGDRAAAEALGWTVLTEAAEPAELLALLRRA